MSDASSLVIICIILGVIIFCGLPVLIPWYWQHKRERMGPNERYYRMQYKEEEEHTLSSLGNCASCGQPLAEFEMCSYGDICDSCHNKEEEED